MFAQTQNELHNMKHMSILAVSLLALVACTPEKKQEADYSQYVNPMIGMLMIPKTCSYVCTVRIGYNAMKAEAGKQS